MPEPIMELADRVVKGEILLPKFQREFVWTRGQVLDLLDSIAHNYPIGSLLLWASDQDLASDQTIADLQINPRRAEGDVSYLLDGRQRLSCICGALYWTPDADPASYWNIVYDLAEGRFLHREDLADPPPHQVPVRMLLDSFELLERLMGLDPDQREAGKELFRRFQKYSVAVVTLKDMPIKEIGRIFERVNTRGTPLRPVEIIRAATWTPDFDLLDAMDRVCGILARKHYGQIDRTILLRAVSASAGHGFSIDDLERLPDLSSEELTAAIETTERAARWAVDFLTTEIGTPTVAALPYMNQFAVVAEIFRQVPRPTAVQHVAIRRWFWRTVLGAYFRGWNKSQMVADLAAIAEFAAQRSKEIEVVTSPPSSSVWIGTQYLRNSGATKAFALMLAAAQPVDLVVGSKLDVGKALAQSNEMEYHHFFPQAWLRDQGMPADRANVLANIVMLTSISNKKISDQRPSAYLQEEIDFSGEDELKARLETCLISPPAFEAAMRDDYEAFVAARAETLTDWVGRLTHGAVPGLSLEPHPETADAPPADDEPVDLDTED